MFYFYLVFAAGSRSLANLIFGRHVVKVETQIFSDIKQISDNTEYFYVNYCIKADFGASNLNSVPLNLNFKFDHRSENESFSKREEVAQQFSCQQIMVIPNVGVRIF